MKSKLKKFICAVMILTMVAAVFVSCGNKDKASLETEAQLPDGTVADTMDTEANTQNIYKEQFYCNVKDVGTFAIKLTENRAYCEYSLKMGYFGSDVPIQYSDYTCYSEGSYYIDEKGNYVIERLAEFMQNEYFGIATGEMTGHEEADTFALEKISDSVYYASDNFFVAAPFIKLGATEDKFITFGKYNEYIEQNSALPTKLQLVYVDGKTGDCESVEIPSGDFDMPDLSVVGDATVKVTYNGEQYNVACHIYPEGENEPYDYFKFAKDFNRLYSNTSKLSRNIAPNTTYDEYFAEYTGEQPLFYYLETSADGGNTVKAVENYTVENWDTSVIENGGVMVYRVSYETDTAIYQFTNYVYVVDANNVEKGRALSLKDISLDNRYDGIYYVAKGTELTELTGNLTSYSEKAITGAKLSVANYNPDTVGIQMVELTGTDMVGKKIIPVYVYDVDAPILVKVSFPSAEAFVFNGNSVDYEKTKLKFTYCDGSVKEYAMKDYADQIHEIKIENTYSFRIDSEITVDGRTYKFSSSSEDIYP